MNKDKGKTGGDPEERAFSGQPDHPPADADQSPDKNKDLLRGGGGTKDQTDDQGGTSPGDQASTLPGYG